MNIDERLKHTQRGKLLLRADDQLIETRLEPVELAPPKQWPHPLEDCLDPEAYVDAGATVAVISDNDVAEAFTAHHAQAAAKLAPPSFLLAGARKQYRRDPANLRVGVLTAGGNAPGLDTVVDALVKRQFLLGTKCCRPEDLDNHGYPRNLHFFGIRGGYKGLESLRGEEDSDWVMRLHPRITDEWSLQGCSSLHVLRTASYDPEKDKSAFDSFVARLVANVRELQLDVLYTCGGNGTLSLAQHLAEILRHPGQGEKPCVVVAGPKTMDNDINFTDSSFGFRTVADNSIRIVADFHREAETLERVGILELFGAGSGFVALHAAYASGEADYVLIPESMGNTIAQAQAELANAVHVLRNKHYRKKHALLVVAEGATVKAHAAILADPRFRRRIADRRLREAKELLGQGEPQLQSALAAMGEALDRWVEDLPDDKQSLDEFKHQNKSVQDQAFADLVGYVESKIGGKAFASQPKHLIRATPPGGYDLDLCKYTGKLMVDTALSGYTSCSVQLWQGSYVLVPLKTAIAQLKQVDTSGYYFKTMWEKYLLETDLSPHQLSLKLQQLIRGRFNTGDVYRISDAEDKAAIAHAGQKRKHGAPYILHPLRVAILLLEEFNVREPELVIVALLHDSLEDAPERISEDEMRAYGRQVLELVSVLTSPPESEIPDKESRNRAKADKVSQGPDEAKLIKLVDRIDNVRDALKLEGPAGEEFRHRYDRETREFYLPMAKSLENPRALELLEEALAQLS